MKELHLSTMKMNEEKCKCCNTFDPEDIYCGMCDKCKSGAFMCTECLSECECRDHQFCFDFSLDKSCKVCEMTVICDKDCEGAAKCERCEDIVCEECTRRFICNVVLRVDLRKPCVNIARDMIRNMADQTDVVLLVDGASNQGLH
jgi:hypothetical protein